MSLLETQQVLARLYTDPEALSEFLRDSQGFAARYGSDSDSILRDVDRRQLEFFATSLMSKRVAEVRKLLPLTTRALGTRFAEEFRIHSATSLPAGARKHLADAMAFCEYLLGRLGRHDATIGETAAYELLSFKLQFDLVREGEAPSVVQVSRRRRPWMHVRRFAGSLPELSGLPESKGVKKKRRLVLFVRLPGLQGVWYW